MGLFAAAAVLLALFAWWELRSCFPMLDLRLFRAPAFSIGSLAITLAFFVMFGMFFLLTQYFQFVQGHRHRRHGQILCSPPPTAPRSTPPSQHCPPAPPKAGVGSAVNDLTREVGAIGIAVMGSCSPPPTAPRSTPPSQQMPAGAADAAGESIGAALGVAEQLDPGSAGGLVLAAQEAFMDGLALSMAIGAAVVAVCIVAVLRFMPPRIMEPADEEGGARAQPLPEQA